MHGYRVRAEASVYSSRVRPNGYIDRRSPRDTSGLVVSVRFTSDTSLIP